MLGIGGWWFRGDGLEDGLTHPDVGLFVGGAAAVGLVMEPVLIGAVVLALEFRLVAEPGGVRGAGGGPESFDGAGVELSWLGVGILRGKFGDAPGEGIGRAAADATEAPVGVGHFADAAEFGGVGGGEVSGEIGEEGFVFGGIFTREKDGFGAGTVVEIVQRRGGLAGVGAGSGGELRVGLVGEELSGGRHGRPF